MKKHLNNFDALRLLGAFLVLVNHSMELSGDKGFGFGGMSVSTAGVKIFFSISGYLIANSWMTDPNVARFLFRRARRIVPALMAVVLLSIFVLGPFFTSLPFDAYASNPLTKRYFGNLFFYVSYALPMVFDQNLHPNAVNGSLWTLPAEVGMYFLTPALVFVALRHYALMILLFLVSVGLGMVFFLHNPSPFVVAGTELWIDVTLAPYFVAGAAIASLRLERFLDWRLGIVGIILGHLAVPYTWPWSEAIYCFVLPYATVAIGIRSWPVARSVGRWGDFSYGIYLWSFPFQQSVVALHGATGNGWANVALALPPTLLMAVLSFHLIEKRAMAWRLGGRPAAVPVVANI